MHNWKVVKWAFIKDPRSRYVGTEIDGVFCIVDIFPFFAGLLSFPQVHGWQQLPLYYPKSPEAEVEMRKLICTKKGLKKRQDKIDNELVGMMVFYAFGLFTIRPLLLPWMSRLGISGIFGILSIVLTFWPAYYFGYAYYRRPLREEIKTYAVSSSKVSIRYRQDRGIRFASYVFSVMPLLPIALVYSGELTGLPIGLMLGICPIITHVIPDDADIKILLREGSRNIKLN